MQGRLSLRERLVILIVAAILPLFALSAWGALREIRAATELAQSQLRFAASLVAANQDAAVESARQLLGAISAIASFGTRDRSDCQAYFEDLRGRYPVYSNIGLLGLDGRVICHANGEMGDANAADRGYFRDAVSQRRFVMGEVIVGRLSGRRAIPFALPVLEQGVVTGVVFATLALDGTSAALLRLQLPQGARVLVADRHANLLMELPVRGEMPAPRPLLDRNLVEAARNLAGGTGEGRDPGGEARVYAYVPSRPVGDAGFLAVVSVDKARVTGTGLETLRRELLMLALALLLGIAGAWWLGGRVIFRPARQIVDAARQLERGDLDVRIPMADHRQRGEFARIAGAFNLMAESLQLRQQGRDAELDRSRSAYEVLDLVLNSMSDALVAVDRAGRFLMFNEAASRLFPLQGPAALAHHWPQQYGLFHTDGKTLYDSDELPAARALGGETGRHMQMLVRNALVPAGRLVQCSYEPVRNGGEIRGALMVFTDITERRAADRALRESERELQDFTRMLQRATEAAQEITSRQSLPETLHAVALQARHVLGVSQAVVKLGVGQAGAAQGDAAPISRPLRLAHDELLAHPQWRGFTGFDGRAPVRGLLVVPLVDRNGINRGLLLLSDKQEGAFSQRDEYMALELAQLASIAIENARLFQEVLDLNAGLETRIAERTAALSQQEALYRTLAEQAPEVVWNVDAAGCVTYLNRAWCELVGGKAEDWLGQRWVQRIHPDDVEAMRTSWQRSRRTLSPYAGTRRVRALDGSYHTMSYKGSPVLDEAGEVAFWVGIDTDITELKGIEQALRSSNLELEAFSYSVSHDLRAPLGAIGGFNRALSHRLHGHDDERVHHFLSRIQAGVGKMEQLIDALLSLAKVVRAPLRYERVDIGALAREALESLREIAPERDVQVTVQDELLALGDNKLMRIVMENLLGNAWKFTSNRASARIEVARLPDSNVFFVRDNGVGFDMAYADKLFGAFQRLHTEAEFPGTGVGLATVRRIVARHQGRVWGESRPGQGTTFFFVLSEAPPPAWLAGSKPAA